ncbi:MAG: hypothetical protein A2231_03185 [Candidatus Firestonebacteria bacterium RIFOXYA2_FULL_40_8]|nr:MAG: hypothetical protein A2231_03185 [Candidatus Firestonebacteria bacterium RIFOXYA2_FULL_40_8]
MEDEKRIAELEEKETVRNMLQSRAWKIVMRDLDAIEKSNIENLINSADMEDEQLKGEIRGQRNILIMLENKYLK